LHNLGRAMWLYATPLIGYLNAEKLGIKLDDKRLKRNVGTGIGRESGKDDARWSAKTAMMVQKDIWWYNFSLPG
jgi:hypothetical protein